LLELLLCPSNFDPDAEGMSDLDSEPAGGQDQPDDAPERMTDHDVFPTGIENARNGGRNPAKAVPLRAG
jgi:hypothetical protein